jgi:hypothetical protein
MAKFHRETDYLAMWLTALLTFVQFRAILLCCADGGEEFGRSREGTWESWMIRG